MKGRAFLIHWNAAEAEELAGQLRVWGWEVTVEAQDGARAGRAIRASPPDVVVMSLVRLPSHGRETASYLRSTKATRETPVVFVDGTPEAVEKTGVRVPDGIYSTLNDLESTLEPFRSVKQSR